MSALTPSPEHFALMHNALDHIARTARKSRTSTRRLRWIEERANDALAGRPYTPVDLPKDGGPDTAEKLRRKMTEAVAERDQLRAFARAVFKDFPESMPDGFDLQDMGIEHGLLVGSTVTSSCGENCQCASYNGDDIAAGITCYRRSALLKGAL